MNGQFADVFNGDLFRFRSITDYILKKPYIPQSVSLWLPWTSKGEYLPVAFIDMSEGTLDLIPEAPRGAPGDAPERDTTKAIPVNIPHYPQRDTLMAESVRGVRAAGTELELAFETERNGILDKMHKRNLLRWEYAKVSAIKGLVYETTKDGQTVIRTNWFNIFGEVQQELEFDFDLATFPVVQTIIEGKSMSEDELGEFDANGYVLICGKEFHKALVTHPKIAEAYNRWNDGALFRDDTRKGFPIASDVTVVAYTRGKIGGAWLIEPDEAYLCPIADDMYQARFAPGIGVDTLGAIGEPEHWSTKVLDHNEGVEIKGSTSILAYVQRLRSIIKFKIKP